MAEFSRSELRSLLTQNSQPCVTLTMPIVQTGRDQHQNRTRFKNLLREAEQRLTELLKHKEAVAILRPARAVLDNEALDVFQRSGLAMYLSTKPDEFRYYQVDILLEEKVVIADRFYVKPLIPLLTMGLSFYVLTLSQNGVHLLEGSRYGLHRLDVPNLPANLADALQIESPGRNPGERPIRAPAHTGAPGHTTGIGSEAATFAGRGAGEADRKQELEQYCHLINAAVHAVLKDRTDPLILVAVDYLHPLYRAANTYPYLLEEGIKGNPVEYDARTIIDRVEAIVEPMRKQTRAKALDRYKELLTKKQASNRLVEVLQAAHIGQVDTLFVPGDMTLWGTYNFDNNQLEVHSEERAGDADLLDLAATQTLLNGGIVYVVPSNEMPTNAKIAAYYRYPQPSALS